MEITFKRVLAVPVGLIVTTLAFTALYYVPYYVGHVVHFIVEVFAPGFGYWDRPAYWFVGTIAIFFSPFIYMTGLAIVNALFSKLKGKTNVNA